MKRDELITALKEYFQRKAEVHDVETACLYGSWAAGHPRPDSDVDVAVMFRKDRSDKELFDRVTTISLDLTRLLKLEVNVLHIDRELSKPMLHYNAIVHGVPVHQNDFETYGCLRLKAISMMEDFTIFGEKWRAELVRRRMEALHHA